MHQAAAHEREEDYHRQEETEADRTRRLLVRGHIERWFGKGNLLSDPSLLRELVSGDGWARVEPLCTIAKMRLIRAKVSLVASLTCSHGRS